jgi:hypothetical protein
MFYFQARVEQSEPFFHLSSFIFQFLLRCQIVVKPYRHVETAIRESMCPAGYPEKTHASLAPQARARPTRSTPVTSSRSPSKLGLQAPTLEARPQSGA